MLAPLLPAALCLVASVTPRTDGAYVAARIATCFEQGACSSLDLDFAPSLQFTEGELTVDWVMESKRVRWRATPRGVEFQRDPSGPWMPLVWRVLQDGAVETGAFLEEGLERVRWIAGHPHALGGQWDERWTAAQLARLSGTWGSGSSAAIVGSKGVEQGGALQGVVARPCLERCVGPAFHVCLMPRPSPDAPTGPVAMWVVRADGLEAVARGELCGGGPWGYVEAFDPLGSTPLRRTDPPAARAPRGIAAEAARKAVAARARVHAGGQAAKPAPVDLSVTVQSSGLPSQVSVKGIDARTAAGLEALLWSLILPPGDWGAPPTHVNVRVELSSR